MRVYMKLIPLQNGLAAKVDDDVYEWASKFVWKINLAGGGKKYVYRNAHYRTFYLHREVMGDPKGLVVDHRFADTLDCRREKLRVATRAQNSFNRLIGPGELRGVKYCVRWKQWQAVVCHVGRRYVVGLFPSLLAARDAYDQVVVQLRGEFAWPHSCPLAVQEQRAEARASMEFLRQKLTLLANYADHKRQQNALNRAELIRNLENLNAAHLRDMARDQALAEQQERYELNLKRARQRYAERHPFRDTARPQPARERFRKPARFQPARVAVSLGIAIKRVRAWMQAGEFGELIHAKGTDFISEAGFKQFQQARKASR
jgi:hypothetical protein